MHEVILSYGFGEIALKPRIACMLLHDNQFYLIYN